MGHHCRTTAPHSAPMTFSRIYSRADLGLDAPLVIVETHLSAGLPGFNLVGLPETAVRESRERVRSALLNSGFQYPARRITVNLAPADMPKRGGRHDLAIAIGILCASRQLPADAAKDREFVGELALSGQIRPVSGGTAATLACRDSQRTLILPAENHRDAAIVRDNDALLASSLGQVCADLAGDTPMPKAGFTAPDQLSASDLDLREVQGQKQGCRALEIAAAGGHNMLLTGPPGTGKTLLSERLPSILPPLDEAAMLQIASIYSAAGLPPPQSAAPPWRAPHHQVSTVALIGGSSRPKPGEISLAHKGVLFLDELPEFRREALESLRQPMESGSVLVSRAGYKSHFPARFQLLTAMNPCPCGYLGDAQKDCECTPAMLRRYSSRLSGPLLDRMDIFVELPRPNNDSWHGERGDDSSEVRGRVLAARARCRVRGGHNSAATAAELRGGLGIGGKAQITLETAVERLKLSPRARGRTLKLARTIADLAESDTIEPPHLTEALSYRPLLKQ